MAAMGSKMPTISKIMLKCALLLLDSTDLYASHVCNLPLYYFFCMCVKESCFNNKICY